MPELPEVQTVCNGLRKTILGQKINNTDVIRRDLRIMIPDNFSKRILNTTIESISRIGKYILITLNNSSVMIIHLGMSGRIIVRALDNNITHKHDHVIFYLDNKKMVFNDPRRFGLIAITSQKNYLEHYLLKTIGVDPFDKQFNTKKLINLFKHRNSAIKQCLMNAKLIAGIGNIYASEILFESKINPFMKANEIRELQAVQIIKNTRKVLTAAIESGGSTLRDYVASSGENGYFQHQFKVYGREGKPCFNCSNTIQKRIQTNRSTFYCAACQKQ